jgi:hypothetical protein
MFVKQVIINYFLYNFLKRKGQSSFKLIYLKIYEYMEIFISHKVMQ